MKEDEPETNENEIDDEITILYDAMCEYTILDLEATLFHFHRPEYLDEVEDRVRSYFSVALQHCGHLDADHPVKYTGLSDDVLNDSSSSGKKKKVRGKDNKNEKAPKNEYTDEEKDEAVILENEVDLRDLTYCAVIETMQMLCIPERSRDPDPAPSTIYSPDEIHSKVTYLNSLVYPAQRTPEWYLARSKLFSASAISKLLTSIAQYNSLIFEKCNPPSQFGGVDTGPREALCPLTWGIKYEPLTAMVYEHLNPGATVRTTYGCIQHPVHSFIGASPDGIVVSPDSPKYGRMVEIKNIWNRAITGIPKLEYYVQMQFQMDVCELPACDFVETRFKEYGTAAECFADEEREREGAHCRGVILYFSGIVEPDPLQCMFDDEDNEDGVRTFQTSHTLAPPEIDRGPTNFYTYMPFYVRMVPWAVDAYIAEQRAQRKDTHELCQVSYWYLDEYSCVQVDHNPLWIAAVIPTIRRAWADVEAERESGAPNRAPKRRPAKSSFGLSREPNPANKDDVVCMFDDDE